ncbi:hypothetical protein FOL47_002604 [Perkinsus chesapeaki]|uniref:Uncharacterized protein n=1 Tax=Perkinsus chesapeaki TaxID=330153 RepID=A0A7J6KP94_PERCH|nr:hypothetical protein FOL47_002604 [Perkinsus chesapeaki]
MPNKKQLVVFVVLVLFTWAVCLIFPPLRGTSPSESIVDVPYCETVYWILAAVQAVILLTIPISFIAVERSSNTLKVGLILGVAMIVVGLVSSMVGIGGGILMNPLVLALGLDPKQATATTAVIIFVTSSSTALSFALGGYFPPSSDMWILIMPFFGALLGKTIIAKLISMTGRLSVLVILLGTVVAIGGIVTLVTGILNTIDNAEAGQNVLEFGDFC